MLYEVGSCHTNLEGSRSAKVLGGFESHRTSASNNSPQSGKLQVMPLNRLKDMWSMVFLSEYRVEVNLSKRFRHADILTYSNQVLKGVRLVAVHCTDAVYFCDWCCCQSRSHCRRIRKSDKRLRSGSHRQQIFSALAQWEIEKLLFVKGLLPCCWQRDFSCDRLEL